MVTKPCKGNPETGPPKPTAIHFHILRGCYVEKVKVEVWVLSFFFFVVLGFELRAYTLSHSTSSFL
jgi:hypothetical protein